MLKIGEIPVLTGLFLVILAAGCSSPAETGPYQATGIRIGEVTDSQVIIWTRLTRNPARVGDEAPLPEVLYRNPENDEWVTLEGKRDWEPKVRFPEGASIDTIEGAVPGSIGEVQLLYRIAGTEDWLETDWRAVDPARDYTRKFALSNLTPATEYELRVRSRKILGGAPGAIISGHFRTAPGSDTSARVVFTVSTGQAYPDQDLPEGGFKIYSQMISLDPDFFVHTGDILYYDRLAKTLPLARWHWARTYSLSSNLVFHRRVPTYFMKDDHDTWQNDCWPGMQSQYMGEFTFEQGQAVFLEQTPMGQKTWRTFRWGKDLQIWLVEGRDFRSPNPEPDGPEKTIWGDDQKKWFKETVAQSDATFRILISPTPLVGPDRTNKHDNHSNVEFRHEGNELREFMADQNNMVIVCGDRHWQYISIDPETGLREYSCGPASNQHAGGWRQDDKREEHLYLNVTGGFLAVIVEQIEGKPTLIFRHYSVDGEILNEDQISS